MPVGFELAPASSARGVAAIVSDGIWNRVGLVGMHDMIEGD